MLWTSSRAFVRHFHLLIFICAEASAQEQGLQQQMNALKFKHLDLVRAALTGSLLRTPQGRSDRHTSLKAAPGDTPFDQQKRDQGMGDCEFCVTMVGNARLLSNQEILMSVLRENVPGDVVEAGVWRGGSSILFRTILSLFAADQDRRTVLCDSFQGLPAEAAMADVPIAGKGTVEKATYLQPGQSWSKSRFYVAGEDLVRDNFERFGAMHPSVVFVRGWFNTTLPNLRRQLKQSRRPIAVLRGDGDMYESYAHTLFNLYHFVSPGGYFICDDCPRVPEAMRLVNQFREVAHVTEPMVPVKGSMNGVFWKVGSELTAEGLKHSRDCYNAWLAGGMRVDIIDACPAQRVRRAAPLADAPPEQRG